MVIFSMAGGALADSVDRRKILLFGQSAAMLITAGLAAVSVLDAREVWRLSAATFLVAVVGSRFVGARPSILALRAMDFGVTFMAGYRAILPVFAKDILGVGPEGLGILTGASGVGAVFGSITIILLGGVRRKGVFVMATTSL
ncbi:MAG: MFS transporter, partial [Chloroflexi bacterium]|nr:MFS transporter [Chloroflexota bacterium]